MAKNNNMLFFQNQVFNSAIVNDFAKLNNKDLHPFDAFHNIPSKLQSSQKKIFQLQKVDL